MPPSSLPKVKPASKPASPKANDKYQAEKKLAAPRPSAPTRRLVEDNKPKRKYPRPLLLASVAAGCGILVVCIGLGGGLLAWVVNRGADEARKASAENVAEEVQGQDEPRPEPAVQLPPIEPMAHVPEGPVPAQLDAAALRKVKQATVHLHVDLPNGNASKGSGFLCVAPGIVVTNAHVLGMLRSDNLPPSRVEVVLHSGEPDEKKTTASVLGVDRTNDLAVLRLPDDFGPLPQPLPVDSASKLIETQRVYIFGFPLSNRIGKNITVSESSVSSLHRDDAGVLSEVQVNGGMTHGNSGGPVTDARGVVIGVAVRGVDGTQLNFAIPGDLVLKVLGGCFADSEFGSPYQKGDRVLLPVKVTCLDPLRQVRQMKLDVGIGVPGAGPRTTYATVFREGAFSLEVPLPSSNPGQACWIQPILVKSSGQSERAKALPVPTNAQIVLERKPALLQFKPPSKAIERTLQMESNVALSIYQSKEKSLFREKMTGKVLESLNPDQRGIGTFIRLTLADCPFTREKGEQKLDPQPQDHAFLKQFSPTFLVNEINACRERGKRDFNVVAADHRSVVESMYETVCNTYESTTLPLPNRMVQPLETWQTSMPMFVLSRGKRQILDIAVTCTYEGVHATAGGTEAHLALSGTVKGRGAHAARPLGKAHGQARLDVERGFLTLVHLTVSTEVEIEDSDVRVLVKDQSIVHRSEGNQLGIAAATRDQPGLPVQRQPNVGPTRVPRYPPGMPIRRPPFRR